MRKSQVIVLVILAVLTTLTLVLVFLVEQRKAQQLPILGQIESFTLTDAKGKGFNTASLKGQIWVADFMFTACPTICPILSGNMAKLSRTYAMLKDVSFVSITVNPEGDTPEVLEQYSRSFTDIGSNWIFLTGPKDIIYHAYVDLFKLPYEGDLMAHSSYFTLIDGQGRVRGRYDGLETPAIERLFQDISTLLKER